MDGVSSKLERSVLSVTSRAGRAQALIALSAPWTGEKRTALRAVSTFRLLSVFCFLKRDVWENENCSGPQKKKVNS